MGKLTCRNNILSSLRTGIGYDAHRFAENRKLILGGVEIDHPRGLDGHSDADVLTHAVIDSLLGAAGEGNIGELFPDTDPDNKDIRSIFFLEKVYEIFEKRSITIINIDSVIICETPKIGPHVDLIKKNFSEALGGLSASRIGIKGKTAEKMGFTGRQEGIAVHAVSLISL